MGRHIQQLVGRDAQDLTEGWDEQQIGQIETALPLGDRLEGYAQPLGQLPLTEAIGFPQAADGFGYVLFHGLSLSVSPRGSLCVCPAANTTYDIYYMSALREPWFGLFRGLLKFCARLVNIITL